VHRSVEARRPPLDGALGCHRGAADKDQQDSRDRTRVRNKPQGKTPPGCRSSRIPQPSPAPQKPMAADCGRRFGNDGIRLSASVRQPGRCFAQRPPSANRAGGVAGARLPRAETASRHGGQRRPGRVRGWCRGAKGSQYGAPSPVSVGTIASPPRSAGSTSLKSGECRRLGQDPRRSPHEPCSGRDRP
jgi:hypothetical protein